ncbi:MAG: tRNA (cytidine(34)-2'-O)-methyltransferase [Proteobacteria bacterium]|jgi:tRNA (cytidine/uridine-2'-O-)-methyltransferase|nr:tRNA (cytidine(34)-2'-O)-methyltransferase [Alphaproteobacteria bacterium]NCC03987.1 tRNA (cytidine(34)-2'-O)-methyltransferase [Pseudomonadota bacterium]
MNDLLSLSLYQPDIPTNTGSLLRLGACLGVPLQIIEPCGFVWDDKKLKRVAMDYIDHATYRRYKDWQDFKENGTQSRIVLLSTQSSIPYTAFTFQPGDTLLLGRESAGVPEEIHQSANARILIPMINGARSLNIALSAAVVLGEALRQLGGFPAKESPLTARA